MHNVIITFIWKRINDILFYSILFYNSIIDKTHTFTNSGITSLNKPNEPLVNTHILHARANTTPQAQSQSLLQVPLVVEILKPKPKLPITCTIWSAYCLYITSWKMKHHHTNIHSNIHNVPQTYTYILYSRCYHLAFGVIV